MGEKDFLDAAGTFYQKYKTTGATTEEFVSHLKQKAEGNIDLLIQEWIFSTESSRLILEGMPIENLIKRYRR
jgi:hypothetical protein